MTVCPWLAGWGHGGYSGAACRGGTTWAGLPAFVLDFLKRLLGKESLGRLRSLCQGACLEASWANRISRVDHISLSWFPRPHWAGRAAAWGTMRELTPRPSGAGLSRLPVACGPRVLVWEVPFPGAQWSLDSRTWGDAEIIQGALPGHSHYFSGSIGTIVSPFHRGTD